MSVFESDWNNQINFEDIEKHHYQDYVKSLKLYEEKIMILFENGFNDQRFTYNGVIDPNNDGQLLLLMDKNKQLRHDIDVKLEEIKRQQTKYESYKKEQKLLSQEVKETHEAFLMAKKYYKKFLKFYYTIEKRNKEKQTIFLQFFTEAKKDSETYSLRLVRNIQSGNYELLSTTPKLHLHKELERRLKETNDVPGVLCSIRQAFVAMKENKN